MIKYQFTKENNHIQEIKVTGHANYAEHGEDIVCAAVSTAIIVTANAIEVLNLKDKVQLDLDEGYFKLEVNQVDEIVEGLLTNLEYTLNDLEITYSQYIKNQKKEG
ncbi:MAG: ribosomal-processing cysteine protease Prp [Candidatus Phytoplasma sp.]|nr:ribosomal-processing cysteine protease Prp [Phytoplasma sp.]